jgi:hypothetical protein
MDLDTNGRYSLRESDSQLERDCREKEQAEKDNERGCRSFGQCVCSLWIRLSA